MEYDVRQRQVEQVRGILERGWAGSPGVLREHAAVKPEELRRDLYALYWRLSLASSEPADRAAMVEFMLEQTIKETPLLRDQLLKWLQDFRKDDFPPNAQLRLLDLPWTDEYCPEIIRLIGIAEARQAIPRLNAQVVNHPLPEPPPPGFETRNTWAAMLALARMGDEAMMSAILLRVQQEEDVVLRASVLHYDLGYTRRPAAFDALKKYLHSEQRLPRIKDNVPGRMEASHAAAVFSRHLKQFPIQETDFNEEQTFQARLWVNAQKSWQFK